MALTILLGENEVAALRERADRDGVSIEDMARAAIRDFVDRRNHREDVSAAATKVMRRHSEALEQLAQ